MIKRAAITRYATYFTGISTTAVSIFLINYYLNANEFAVWGIANSLIFILSQLGQLTYVQYIEKYFPGVEVVYTRENDVFLELWERTEIANNRNADLFISIHCDGFKNSNASGASVFVMGMSKLKANMDVEMRENSVIYLEDNFK